MKKLAEYFRENDIPCDEETLEKFAAYRDGVLRWNEKVNLTAIRDPREFTEKHFVDSVTCFNTPEYAAAQTVLDLGTGAGFPGVPLAILSPEKEFLLVDSLNKRLKIVAELCEELEIRNVRVLHGRAEDVGRAKEHREKYDLCVSRAVAELSVLMEYALPLVASGGFAIAYKGAEAEAEAKRAKNAVRLLGGSLRRIERAPAGEDADRHSLIIVEKEKPTPSKYPRKAGTPTKEPLK